MCIGAALQRLLLYKPMTIGVVLMAYPYFVPQTWL